MKKDTIQQQLDKRFGQNALKYKSQYKEKWEVSQKAWNADKPEHVSQAVWDKVSDIILDTMIEKGVLDRHAGVSFPAPPLPGKPATLEGDGKKKPQINTKNAAGGKIPKAVRRYLKASSEVQAEWDREANRFFGENALLSKALRHYKFQADLSNRVGKVRYNAPKPVSYTHLTLPTIYSV